MDPNTLTGELASTHQFFTTTIAVFTEAHATYAPKSELYTVAAHIAHVARTVDWFTEGAFVRVDGFDMNFPTHIAEAKAVTSLAKARAWLDRAFAEAATAITTHAARLDEPLPSGIMGGAPRAAIIGGIVDHTAHHRGALAVYARLLGLEPAMPYG